MNVETAAVVLLALAIGASTAIRAYHLILARRMRGQLAVIERRESNQEFLRLLEEMQTMNSRYENFTRRALIAQAFVAIACIGALAIGGVTLHRTTELTKDQAKGRAVAIEALCASTSAVVDAGRHTIAASAKMPPKLERALERLGYPTHAQRSARAQLAAKAYGKQIAKRVEEETHVRGLARPDGTLDCSRLKRASRVNSGVH